MGSIDQFDPIPAAESAWESAQERREAEVETTRRELEILMTDALLRNPLEVVPTPAWQSAGYRANHAAASAAMVDLSDEIAVDLCRLLAACNDSTHTLSRVLAQSIIARIAQQYADTHCDVPDMLPFGPVPEFPSIRRTA